MQKINNERFLEMLQDVPENFYELLNQIEEATGIDRETLNQVATLVQRQQKLAMLQEFDKQMSNARHWLAF